MCLLSALCISLHCIRSRHPYTYSYISPILPSIQLSKIGSVCLLAASTISNLSTRYCFQWRVPPRARTKLFNTTYHHQAFFSRLFTHQDWSRTSPIACILPLNKLYTYINNPPSYRLHQIRSSYLRSLRFPSPPPFLPSSRCLSTPNL
ncbi:hypothetical protein BKA61DRAFT_349589 [Leptodontidium sp. MPI-SDFR-AT-0119]|nr:hypothetical protein BKA61DRAFT_349589 [Leptodontidium sp. MPI-SDFR-AT-0119]